MSYLRGSLKLNIIANFIGRASSVLVGVLATPFYIHFLGIEAYGLIGFYLTLQGSMTVLELGVGRACIREIARLSGQGRDSIAAMGTTLRTLELVYWVVALLIGCVLTVLAPIVSQVWLTTDVLNHEALESVIICMAWVIAVRWPIGVYQGAMMGLQRQVSQNALQIACSVLTAAISIVVLWRISPTIEAFFQWQLLAAILILGAHLLLAWALMPAAGTPPRFSFAVMRRIFAFSAGVGFNAVLGTALRQADKLIVSAILPLTQFGYYVLASLIAQVAAMPATAVSSAVFPKFSQIVGSCEEESVLPEIYRLASVAVAVVVIPITVSIALFSEEFLFVYTGESVIAAQAASVLSILIIAKALHASMIVPYALQLAFGWVRLSIYINVFSVIWLIPAIYIGAQHYGIEGAASAWLVVTLAYVFAGVPLMHRRLLVGQADIWFRESFLVPSMVAVTFLLTMMQLELAEARWILLVELILLTMLAVLIVALSSSRVRSFLIENISLRLA